ncbi:M3 family metallopeptidase [Paracoccus luteus]|uniref:M3 family metallopeptidase n=1 Tax=Paracoccus luteus TaxID=2508543 RepID=UPI00106FEF1B|nr:M3 family metallopeptidase [Paracoccus luteus]
MTDAAPNPQLTRWTGPAGLPRFDLIADGDILPAVHAALAQGRAAHKAIATDDRPADFANTIAAMELADEPLDRVMAVFSTLASTCATPVRDAIQRELAPLLSAYGSEIVTDPRLWSRIEAVWAARDALPEPEARLTELTRRNFLRGGAALDAAGRDRMAQIRSRLAVLSTQFGQNLLADERDFVLPVPDDRMGGIPGWLARAMRQAAAERGLSGRIVTLGRSLIVPFLEHSTDRPLREAAQRAFQARGSGAGAGGAATDNLPLIAEILALRHERARLLGHDDYAAMKLEHEMARDAGQVRDLLTQVWAPAVARAAEDQAALEEMARADGLNGPLMAWDWRHYAARRRRALHAIDDDAVKAHLGLDAMIAAAFDVAGRLFGLTAEPFAATLWHPDVRAWRILRDGREMAVFLGDYFARPGKRSGAWCSALQPQHHMGAGQRPIVVNVCNFTPGDPATLSWDEARTLFHEFGHALHHILSDVPWPSISGTSVARDFVELPSQLYEHWLEVPEVLARHARHVQTGAALEPDAVARIVAADKADAGFATVEYLESALVDLAFHSGPPPADPMARQAEVLADLGAPAAIPMRHATPQFQHVFAGDGYAAGYYSYMWSEVMDADAFAAFEEAGDPFDPATAARLEAAILSQGGLRPADDLWIEFRERKPGVEALLRGRGLSPIVFKRE